jgi:Flp pilus assembly protein TadD
MIPARRLPCACLAVALAVTSRPAPAAPEVLLEDWKATFAARPELFRPGVHLVEKPQKAFVISARLPLEGVSLKTPRDRQIARKRAELAAYRRLLDYFYRRDKDKLEIPAPLKRFAAEAIRKEAHGRTLTVRGAQTAAVWVEKDNLGCTVIVAEKNVATARKFAPAFRLTGGRYYLAAYRRSGRQSDLYKAFECDPDSDEVRAALGRSFLAAGQRVAAFLVRAKKARLPGPDDPLAAFLKGATEPAYQEAVKEFEADRPDLNKALRAFLTALDGQYANPDALNYVGACYQNLGWPQLARVFLEQAVALSGKRGHRYAVTNLGRCLAELGRAEEAEALLRRAVELFPDEPWTDQARKALRGLRPAAPSGSSKPR